MPPAKRSAHAPQQRSAPHRPNSAGRTSVAPPTAGGRTRLLEAALKLIRTKGYTATRVEDVCAEAGVTKGAFFHHFSSKEALGVAAAGHWSLVTGAVFEAAPYHRADDPLDRVLGYVEFRRQIVRGSLPEFTCLAGTMVQETFETSPAIRDACGASITGHADTLVADIAEAKRRHVPHADWTPESLALHTQAVLQGAFIVAKATGRPSVATDSIDHLTRYIRFLFHNNPKE